MPADIKVVGLTFEAPLPQPGRKCPDLASLSRLTQLEALHLASPIDQPIPQLPALCFLWVQTADLQALSYVTATLKRLVLVAPDIDCGQPYNLAHFKRLKTLYVNAQTICNFKPEVLPPTLRAIGLGYNEKRSTLDEKLAPAFTVGGTIHRKVADELLQYARYTIRWTHNSLF